MYYISSSVAQLFRKLGLVEFKKCTIFPVFLSIMPCMLGLVEFKKCTILASVYLKANQELGLVEFKKCTILSVSM